MLAVALAAPGCSSGSSAAIPPAGSGGSAGLAGSAGAPMAGRGIAASAGGAGSAGIPAAGGMLGGGGRQETGGVAGGGGSPIGGAGGGSAGGGGTANNDAGVPDDSVHGAFTADQLMKQNCDASRPGFTYLASADGPTVASAPAPGELAPVPCLSLTGQGSTEPSLGVMKDGTVFYGPTFTTDGNGLLHSKNFGETWELLIPKFPNGGSHGRVQPYTYVDPSTDRLFFATNAGSGTMSPATGGFNLSVSADEGATFSYANVLPEGFDWAKIFAGPPVSSTTTGYPNIVYFSAPAPLSTPIPIVSLLGLTPDRQVVYKSLDGGKTWAAATPMDLKPASAGCATNEWIIYGSGAVGPDGTVYQGLRRCTGVSVAVSTDEAKTWTIREIPGATMAAYDTTNLAGIVANPNVLPTELLSVDGAGNVYVSWVDAAGKLRLTYSKDAAKTWSKAVVVSAPAVKNAIYSSVAIKEPGTVAIAYYGSSDGVKYDGYIAETKDAFDAAPLFEAVMVNPASAPLFEWGFEVGYLGILAGSDLNEIVQVKYAPNGDLWASFVKDMCPGADKTACDWASQHDASVFQGAIARLVHGVKSKWGTSPTRLPDPPACVQTDTLKSTCTSDTDGTGVCAPLTTCICDHCACDAVECAGDPNCKAVLICAGKNNCRSWECLFPCQKELLTAGDLQTTRALSVATCANANGCPQTCP
ncbi:MAG TPA: sialidase family protein [Polyangiaceae bacterium]|nr:sialidase family protein [Polyangiaceae bacterium]